MMREIKRIKRMKKGDIDPSKSIPPEAIKLLVSLDRPNENEETALSKHKSRLNSLRDLLLNNKELIKKKISI